MAKIHLWAFACPSGRKLFLPTIIYKNVIKLYAQKIDDKDYIFFMFTYFRY